MNENLRKYREQILRIATDMGDWIQSETKDFPQLYRNFWRFSDRYLTWGAPPRPTVNGKGIVGIINSYGDGYYIRGGRVYECLSSSRGVKDYTEEFLTNDIASCYKDLVAGIEDIYKNWSRIKADVQCKQKQYNSVLSYNGL